MSETGQSAKARGRARGRARGQVSTEPIRRPTDFVPPSSAVPTQVTQPPTPAGTGRAYHRGGAHSDPRPGEAALSTVASAMAAVNLEGSGRGAMRGRRFMMEENFATRPPGCQDKRGTSGEPLKVFANYFKVNVKPTWVTYQYHVEFNPTVESPKMRRAMLYDHLDKLGQSFLFDGMSDLKSRMRMEQPVTEMFSKRRTDDENICITVKFTGELAPNHPEIIRLFNTQMRKNLMHLRFVALGRHLFDPEACCAIPMHRIELWQGVITAIRQHENNMLMVTDTVFKVCRQDTVLDQMRALYQEQGANYMTACQRDLVGTIVMTRYNNRTYKIDDIDWNKNPSSTFESHKTGTTTYSEYYKKQYDITIRDVKQPLLVCRPQEKDIRGGRTDAIYLIPELCCTTGISDKMRTDFTVMKDLAEHTRIGPDRRVQNLISFIQRINNCPQAMKEMSNWGMSFDEQLVEINARVVAGEKIIQGDPAGYTFKSSTGDFSREMRSKPMHVPVHLERFAVVSTSNLTSSANEFVRNLFKVCPAMGMRVSQPETVTLPDDRAMSYLNAIQSLSKKNLQIIILIVPNNKKDRYDAIKKLACVDMPIATQVIVARTLKNPSKLQSVATKIAIQLNCKLGGEAWAVSIPFKNKIMIVGFDTYHDSSQKGRSVGALVASMNSLGTSWYSKVSFHTQREELCDYLHVNFIAALQQYHRINKDLPELIYFYRDGVSDGQIGYVKEHEVSQIIKAYSQLADKKEPGLAFIVVNKRISTRFFAQSPRGAVMNPPPGTVIDTEVTRAERYDFYLVSQSVRQGTVSPTQYNIIEDTTGLTPERMQRLTYKLTHLYYNWPGTIRVPAPCQYAHKLAFLVGQSLHKAPAEQLANTLFYL